MPIRIKVPAGNGDVNGPSSSTNNAIVRFDGSSGKILKDSGVVIDDSNNIDLAAAGTLTLGNSTATGVTLGQSGSTITLIGTTINIGESGATVNIIGDTSYEQVTNLQVADKLITLNKGGAASSATLTGFEIEEDSSITGYIQTDATRNSFSLKAPNTSGIVTITPGAIGFTIDGTEVKSTVSSVTDHALIRFDGVDGQTIQDTNIIIDDSDNLTGVNDLSVGNDLTVTGSTTLNTALNGVLKATAGVISASDVDLTTDITGTLPIANGGTGQTTAQLAFDALSPTTTQGDIIYHGPVNVERLQIGPEHTILRSTGSIPNWTLITNDNIDASAAIVYSKLDLALSIVDADVSTTADITRTKLAPGTANYVLINDASGEVSEEQYLDKTRGGTGITSTATFPASGTINTGTGTTNDIVKFTDALGTIGDSSISDTGTLVTVQTNTMAIGDNTDTDKIIEADNGDVSNPALKYNSTDNKWQYSNDGTTFSDIGSGVGSGINYLSDNPDAETDTTGWATYADAAATIPVDGTGGSPTVTWTRNTTTPLRDDADFKFTKDAANRQGEGVSYDFTIDPADNASVLSITFDYNASDANYIDDDNIVYIYDVTTAELIEPVGIAIKAGLGTHAAYFQSHSSSTSYRFIIHQSSTNATAYNLYFDNFRVGPAVRNFGPVVTDEYDYTDLDNSGFGNLTNVVARWRRIGDSMELIARFTTGIAGAPIASIKLPSGHSIDSNKVLIDNTTSNIGAIVGRWSGHGYTYHTGYIITATSTDATRIYFGQNVSGTLQMLPQGGSSIVTDSEDVTLYCKIPILGWSSSQQISDDADTRVIAMRASGDAASAGAGTAIIFPNTDFDLTNSYDTVTGLFTLPSSGEYKVSGYVQSATASITLNIALDGITDMPGGITDSNGEGNFIGLVKGSKGQTISIEPSGLLDISDGYLCIEKILGPSAIVANELISARYTSDAGQELSSGVEATIIYEDQDYDTHGIYNTSTGEGTFPVSGKYKITAAWGSQDTDIDAEEDIALRIYHNSTIKSEMYGDTDATLTAVDLSIQNNCTINALANDNFYIKVLQSCGTVTTIADGTKVFIEITRQGF